MRFPCRTALGGFVLKITCIGHSGFLVETPDCNLIFDYWRDRAGVITADLFKRKTYVFVSHRHSDHYNKKIFKWREYGDVTYILEVNCPVVRVMEPVIRISEGDEILLPCGKTRVRAYGSTDEGVSFLVKTDSLSIFHAGDLNDWYWEDESTPEELAADEGSYLRIIKEIAGQEIDVAFIPEDPRLGIHSGRGIRFFNEIAAPKKIIPMHYPGNEGIVY